MIVEFCIGASVAAVLVSLNEMRRATVMHNTLMDYLNESYEKRMEVINSFGNSGTYADLQKAVDAIPYPDVHNSYGNLKWYKFWENPRNLVVVEK